jgi:hypothetical protein
LILLGEKTGLDSAERKNKSIAPEDRRRIGYKAGEQYQPLNATGLWLVIPTNIRDSGFDSIRFDFFEYKFNTFNCDNG